MTYEEEVREILDHYHHSGEVLERDLHEEVDIIDAISMLYTADMDGTLALWSYVLSPYKAREVILGASHYLIQELGGSYALSTVAILLGLIAEALPKVAHPWAHIKEVVPILASHLDNVPDKPTGHAILSQCVSLYQYQPLPTLLPLAYLHHYIHIFIQDLSPVSWVSASYTSTLPTLPSLLPSLSLLYHTSPAETDLFALYFPCCTLLPFPIPIPNYYVLPKLHLFRLLLGACEELFSPKQPAALLKGLQLLAFAFHYHLPQSYPDLSMLVFPCFHSLLQAASQCQVDAIRRGCNLGLRKLIDLVDEGMSIRYLMASIKDEQESSAAGYRIHLMKDKLHASRGYEGYVENGIVEEMMLQILPRVQEDYADIPLQLSFLSLLLYVGIRSGAHLAAESKAQLSALYLQPIYAYVDREIASLGLGTLPLLLMERVKHVQTYYETG